MIFSVAALSVTLSALSALPALNLELEHGVSVVKPDNFFDVIGQTELLLMMFYAPWCGHCMALQFPYKDVAAKLPETGFTGTVAKFDATGDDMDTKIIKQMFDVKSFPTVFMFNQGGHRRLTADLGYQLDQDGLMAFAQEYAMPRWQVLTTESELEQVKRTDPRACVGVVESFVSPEANALKTAALNTQKEGPKYYLTKQAFGDATVPSLMLLSQKNGAFREVETRAEATQDYERVLDLVHHFALPPVLSLNVEEAPLIGQSPRQHHFVGFTVASNSQMCETTRELLESLASEFTQILFVFAEVEEFPEDSLQRRLGISDAQDLPAFGFVNKTTRNTLYKFDGAATESNLRAFVKDYQNHQVAPYVKSERGLPVDKTAVMNKLVASTFDDAVFDEDVDFVVLFHNPDTPKWMFNEFEAVAKVFGHVESVLFATFDVTKNKMSTRFLKEAFGLANGLRTTRYLPAMVIFPGAEEEGDEGEPGGTSIAHAEDQLEKGMLIKFLKSRLQTVEVEEG